MEKAAETEPQHSHGPQRRIVDNTRAQHHGSNGHQPDCATAAADRLESLGEEVVDADEEEEAFSLTKLGKEDVFLATSRHGDGELNGEDWSVSECLGRINDLYD